MAKDILDQEFTVGDYIFYSVGSGSSASVKFARVVKDEHKQQVKNFYQNGKLVPQLVDVYKIGVKELLCGGRPYTVWDSAQSKHVPGDARTSYPSSHSMIKASPEQIQIALGKIDATRA